MRLRDLGGIVVIDFIDMDRHEDRRKVYQALQQEIKRDRAKTNILRISELGLVEMTRKRDRENLNRYLCDPCPYCDGTGQIKSASTVCYEAFREVRRSCRRNIKGSIAIFLHSDVFKYIQQEEQEAVKSLEDEMGRSISFKLSEELHHEQFELYEY